MDALEANQINLYAALRKADETIAILHAEVARLAALRVARHYTV